MVFSKPYADDKDECKFPSLIEFSLLCFLDISFPCVTKLSTKEIK